MNHPAQDGCLFCRSDIGGIFIRGELGFVSWDSYPVNAGHALVIPYRHVSSYFDATDQEKHDLWRLADEAKRIIDVKYRPHGYNVGINVGRSAGQSVFHLHIHIIPRFEGDTENPKGGVRGVIPAKRVYP